MRTKLKKFTEFANSMLPHETRYLLSVQQLQDPEKLQILRQIDHNCRQLDDYQTFDPAIDKRKYSHLKNWLSKQLAAIDVDEQFAWMSELERKIHWDNITPAEEKALLKSIRNYHHPIFNFIKFFELVREYRQFLLIRLRYADHQVVDAFLQKYQSEYERSQLINNQIHQATKDIIKHYSENATESIQWEKWLSDIFYDENLDGFNRYTALIRLVFIAFNYNKYTHIEQMFDLIDQGLAEGKYYSRRILTNYYNNRLLLHTRLQDAELAVYYGKLSIRVQNNDYILYVNNLCNVLLQAEQVEASWQILREALPKLTTTHNHHSRIGFISLYIKTLIKKEEYQKARSYGEINLRVYEKEILRYRWHRFFVSYLECLLYLGEYSKVLQTVRKYKLLEKEKKYKTRAHVLPTISWYNLLAQYQLGEFNLKGFLQRFEEYLPAEGYSPHALYTTLMAPLQKRFPHLDQLLTDISKE
ncbi:MAG: hypothetical protein AAF927_23240 [Bacteroidota bacterium]